MQNTLLVLPQVITELMQSKEFWREMVKCVEDEDRWDNIEFAFNCLHGKFAITISIPSAYAWLTYFGQSSDEKEIEDWQVDLRKGFLHYFPEARMGNSFLILMPTKKHGHALVSVIIENHNGNSFRIEVGEG